MKKRIILLGVLGLAASVNGAVVTYTLTLHESTSCQVTANNNFTVWVTVSQGDNAGLGGVLIWPTQPNRILPDSAAPAPIDFWGFGRYAYGW